QKELYLLGFGQLPLKFGCLKQVSRNVAVLDSGNFASDSADYWAAVVQVFATRGADGCEGDADPEGRKFRGLLKREVIVHCGGFCVARRIPCRSPAQHGQASRNGLFPCLRSSTLLDARHG